MSATALKIESKKRRTTPSSKIPRHPPFTRLDEQGCGTTVDFDRERMGIAAKE